MAADRVTMKTRGSKYSKLKHVHVTMKSNIFMLLWPNLDLRSKSMPEPQRTFRPNLFASQNLMYTHTFRRVTYARTLM